jgi:hypothetical protein
MATATQRADSHILWDLSGVECDLSPENLTCDGELSRAQVNKRYRQLMTKKSDLIAELGRTPTDNEVFDAKRPADFPAPKYPWER